MYEHVKLGANAILAKRDVEELRQLVALRKKGWEEEKLDDHFTTLRQTADNPDEKLGHVWLTMMKRVMQGLDSVAYIVPEFKPIEFFDVCCAPGGFSSYILNKNLKASGVGISLPQSSGGNAFILEKRLRSRYQFIERDLLDYDFSPPDIISPSLYKFPPIYANRFPLVLFNGHGLRTYRPLVRAALTPEETKEAYGAYRDCLQIVQLIISLESVCPGGTIVISMSHIERFPAAHILYLFDKLSEKLIVHKPRTPHGGRGTFYAVAKGTCSAQHAELRARVVAGLRELWYELRWGGACGRGRPMVPTDLDFVVTADVILGEYLDRLVELGRPVWSTQVEGLGRLLQEKGSH